MSVWPFVTAGGVTLIAFGIPTSLLFSVAGLLLMAWGVSGWVHELVHE
jgi:hypothetical protein